MNSRAKHTLPIHEALSRSAPLERLQELLRQSNARHETIRPLLPSGLAAFVKPGPVDEEGWSLLVPNAAVAAKLRQLRPRLEEALRDQGWQVCTIRIKVQSA